MSGNSLKLNESKTVFVILGTGKQFKKLKHSSIIIDRELIRIKLCVWNLDPYFEFDLMMEAHVNHIMKVD